MTDTLTADARRNVALFQSGDYSGVRTYKKQDKQGRSVLRVENFPVFRSGTFRDSMGIQHTWEPIHLDQMVANFNLLKARNIFADVPVRKGHGALFGDPIDSLIGWHTDIRKVKRIASHDGKEYDFIDVDFEILDPEAQAKIEAGLWRNRSSEIGSYTTNDEAEFWPVYHGFAFVDIPAVEGLSGYSKNVEGVGSKFSICFENSEEAPVSGTQENPEGTKPQAEDAESQPTQSAQVVPPVTPAQGVTEEQDKEKEQEEVEVAQTQVVSQEEKPETTQPSAHSAQRSFQFKISGSPTTDFAAVQRHIEVLETFQRETLENARKNFVNGLVTANKVPATQLDGLTEFALGLQPSQYEAWKKIYEDAPAMPLFGNHSTSTSNHSNGGPSDNEARIEVLKGIVKHHKDSGLSQDRIEQTSSWKELQELTSDK
jgi:hypothetical protein